MRRPSRGQVNIGVLLVGLALVAVLLGILASGFGNDPRAVPSVLDSQPAPTFVLSDLDGQTWELARLRGKPVVLNFWSTWCGPCKAEHPLLQQAARMYPDVQFLGVVYADEPEACRRYLAQAGTTYDHLIDPDGRIAIEYGVAGVPETFFIDRDGVIVHKHTGPLSRQAAIDWLGAITGTTE